MTYVVGDVHNLPTESVMVEQPRRALPFLHDGPGQLAHTCFLFRHGARFLGSKNFNALSESPVVRENWGALQCPVAPSMLVAAAAVSGTALFACLPSLAAGRPLDALTTTGTEQMRALGAYLVAHLPGRVTLERPAMLFCSPVGRGADRALRLSHVAQRRADDTSADPDAARCH